MLAMTSVIGTDDPDATEASVRPTTPGRTYHVPRSIDRTGTRDVGHALSAFIASVPNGSTIVFRRGTYRCAGPCIRLYGRRHLTFRGRGSTIRNVGDGRHPINSAFFLDRGNHGITIKNFRLRGGNPHAATRRAYHQGVEHASGIILYNGNSDIRMTRLRIRDQWGHCLYMASLPGRRINRRITFRRSRCTRTGVMGLVIASGRRVRFIKNVIRDTALYPIDIEDGTAGQPVRRVTIRNNRIKRWSWNEYYTCHAIVGDSSAGLKPFSHIRVIRNRFYGGDMGRPSGSCRDGGAIISLFGRDRKTDVTIRGNRARLPAHRRPRTGIRLNNVERGHVAGNAMGGLRFQCARCANIR